MHRRDSVVAARFCEGGHLCTPPKECCETGCCYMSSRSTSSNIDHVFNLFFINHWYFWYLILAILLAFLCACSCWKKRRQLCGWGTHGLHSHSELDSAGSCYAPPQYSRCSSFHHAPPAYTEVTSKPDLYPLVFTCNSDNSKNGTSYLMVQYFRNYIVRPTMSTTSTIDSITSSFICTSNEANTIVPPTYSRAASPDYANSTVQFQQQNRRNLLHSIPRSVSQHTTCPPGQPSNGRAGSVPVTRFDSSNNFKQIRSTESVTLNSSQLNSNNGSMIFSGNDFFNNSADMNITMMTVNPQQQQTHDNLLENHSSSVVLSETNNTNRTEIPINNYPTEESENGLNSLSRGQENLPLAENQSSPTIQSTDINLDILRGYESLNCFSNQSTSDCDQLEFGTPPNNFSPNGDVVKELLKEIETLQHTIIDKETDIPNSSSNIQPNELDGKQITTKRPLSLHCKNRFFSRPSRPFYVPINTRNIISPNGLNSTSNRYRSSVVRNTPKRWLSKSAPTTPGTGLPINPICDHSPLLLNQHDEDSENNV